MAGEGNGTAKGETGTTYVILYRIKGGDAAGWQQMSGTVKTASGNVTAIKKAVSENSDLRELAENHPLEVVATPIRNFQPEPVGVEVPPPRIKVG